MKKQWKSFSDIQLQRFQHFREHRELISEYPTQYFNTVDSNELQKSPSNYKY